MSVDDSVTVKGSPVRSLQKFIESDLTPEQREVVYGSLPAEYARRFRGPILPTETIPFRILNAFTEEAARAKGEPLESFARRAGCAAADDAIKGIYRFFAMVLTPAALLSKGSQMWRALYNRGELRVVDQTPSSARIALVDFPSETAGCSRMTGWIQRMGELTSARELDVKKIKCFAKGDDHCEWQLSWRS